MALIQSINKSKKLINNNINTKKKLKMSKLAKILVTIGIIFIWFVINSALVNIRGTRSSGFLGFVIAIGVFAGIRAIWKKNKNNDDQNNNNNSDDSSILQK